MPQITSIESQKSNLKRSEKKGKRFNIYVDDKFAFALGEESLLKFKLAKGLTLNPQQVAQIQKTEQEIKLTGYAINFLSFRPRSEKEIKDYLIKKIATREKIKYNDAKESSLINSVISKLAKYGYVNDVEFANWFIASRNRTKQKAQRIVKIELKQKGIADNIIQDLMQPSENELQIAIKVLEKKRKVLEKLLTVEAKRKAYYYLGSRGFEFDTIKEAFAKFIKKD